MSKTKSPESRHWWIYQGNGKRNENNTPSPTLQKLGEPPPWRRFDALSRLDRGATFKPEPGEIDRVNAALLLRRPLLVTGRPGTGKTSLTYAVAHELGLEPVLRWSITSRTSLQDGLYRYDAIGRLQNTPRAGDREGEQPAIEDYLSLGPVGTAFFARPTGADGEGGNNTQPGFLPRILLIDEIDKSDIDLPNDLLHLFEEGEFEIPELSRIRLAPKEAPDEPGFWIKPSDFNDERSFQHNRRVFVGADGMVHCRSFPLVVMTSNGEREFPPAFLRRCLQLNMELPDGKKLEEIVDRHFTRHPELVNKKTAIRKLIRDFIDRRDGKKSGRREDLTADQLLNAVHLVLENIDPTQRLDKEMLVDALWKPISSADSL